MDPDVELMYRPPGAEKHSNITEVLDELITKVQKQDERILELEEAVEQLLLLIN
tara:strand:+ start:20 stop:181 length:162 start_codon:yes stop_codon:yes gene_type:complete